MPCTILSGGKHRFSIYPNGWLSSKSFRLLLLGRLRGKWSKESTAIQLSQKIIFRLRGGKSVSGSMVEGLMPLLEHKMKGMLGSASLIIVNPRTHLDMLPFSE